ncbi:MAG: glycosyltransferase family 4 protein [Elusimicrobia bacterium]|nr:glycosyltransferase family 4 protein [Elusimicrobiota bacterium]
MKILQLLSEPYDSGLTASALTLAKLLKENGIETGIVCRKKSHAWQWANDEKIETLGFRGPWLVSYPKIARWVNSRGWNILHAHTGSMHTLAWLLARRLPVSILRSRADARPIEKKASYQKLLEKTRFAVFPTRVMREKFLMAYNYPINRTAVIYPSFEGPRHVQCAPSSALDTRIRICLVGRLDPVKGHKDFLQAVQLLGSRAGQAVFEMIGAEKNTRLSDLKALARRVGVEKFIEWRGFLGKDTLGQAMRRADIGVIASRGSEVVSRVCFEWMSLGKPVVATKVGMIPEVVEDGKTGYLVAPGYYEEMSYRLRRLIENPQERQEMGRNAKAVFDARFSPLVYLDAHLKIYRALAKKTSEVSEEAGVAP